MLKAWLEEVRHNYEFRLRLRSTRLEREALLEAEVRLFDEDYKRHFNPETSKLADVGKPFLLIPRWFKAGVVFTHGYMAAPLEVQALALNLCRNGYAVYAVRLKGHGTSPADLAETPWEAWYESVARGVTLMRTITDRVVLGGFSTGGTLALLAAGRMAQGLRAIVSINAPLHLRKNGARFAPTILSVNALLKRIHRPHLQWEYIEHRPENQHINYSANPIAGVAELGKAIAAMEAALPNVTAPALVIQGSRDPAVHPSSGPEILEKLGSSRKEMLLLDRSRHGIINGEGSDDVFERVCHFLDWTLKHPAVPAQAALPAPVLAEAPAQAPVPVEKVAS